MQQVSHNNEKDLAGDSIETYATEVHDAGIDVKDASGPIVEALNNGQPVKPEDLKAMQEAIDQLKAALGTLQDELNQLGPPLSIT